MDKLSTRSFAIFVLIGVGLCLILVMVVGQDGSAPVFLAGETESIQTKQTRRPPEQGYVRVGDVDRPASSVKQPRPAQKTRDTGFDFGKSPAVPARANVSTRKIAESRGLRALDYRRSSLVPAPPFNRVAYLADPEAYLQDVAPARINQALPPAENIVPIKRLGQYFLGGNLPGETVRLSVKSEPGMPVTFKAQLGSFSNQLTTITVAANREGTAEAHLKLSGGTRDEVEVRAASPVHSDIARWLVEVHTPEMADISR